MARYSVSSAWLYLLVILALGGRAVNPAQAIAAAPGPESPTEAPGAFTKLSPGDGAGGISLNPTLQWEASLGATWYEYCYDDSDNDSCSPWTPVGTATSVTLSGLDEATTYFWQVQAYDAADPNNPTNANGSLEAFWSFTTGARPADFAKTEPAEGASGVSLSPTLRWEPSSGASEYEYCYDTTNVYFCSSWITVGTAISATLSGLDEMTSYFWQVRAVNGIGQRYANGASMAFGSFTTGVRPGLFVKSAPSDGASGVPLQPTIQWNPSSGANQYEYCYDSSNDSDCSSWISAGTAISATLSGLSQNTTYYWQVRAVNAVGMRYANGSLAAFRRFTTGSAPGVFVKSNPLDGAPSAPLTPSLEWSHSSASDQYEYCYDTSNDDICSSWTSTGSNSVSLSGLSLNVTYYWQVRSVNAVGTTYAEGSPEAFWRFTTGNTVTSFGKSGPVDGATQTALSPTLTWQALNGASAYEYCYDTSDNDTCSSWINVGTATSVTMPALSRNTSYYWQVRALTSSGAVYANGSLAAFWRFTTPGTNSVYIPLLFKNYTAPAASHNRAWRTSP